MHHHDSAATAAAQSHCIAQQHTAHICALGTAPTESSSAYRPAFDTFACYPPPRGGYNAGEEQVEIQQPLRGNTPEAFTQMQFDLKALNQHGTVFGIDSDPIRVAHAYQNHLRGGAVHAYKKKTPGGNVR